MEESVSSSAMEEYVIFGRDWERNSDGQWKCHHEIYYNDCLINPKMYFSGVGTSCVLILQPKEIENIYI